MSARPRPSVADLVAGLGLSAGLVALHVRHFWTAGALWRDEVTSVNVASLNSFAAVLDASRFDSFPAAWTALLHAWIRLGLGDSDLALRGLGLAVGVATIAVVWWSASRLGVRVPLVALALFGMSPTTLVYGGAAVRGYGLGALGIAWSMGAIFALVRAPGLRAFVVAQVAAILAAQAYFGNCFLLLSICLAGAAVCAAHRRWTHASAVLAVGAIAALSMLINLPSVLYAARLSPIEQGEFGLAFWAGIFLGGLAPGVPSLVALWGVTSLAAVWGAVAVWRGDVLAGRSTPGRDDRDRIGFVVVAAVTGIVFYVAYLSFIRVRTQYWYYMPLLAVLALAIEVGVAVLAERWRPAAIGRLLAVALAVVLAVPNSIAAVSGRMTNLDAIASRIDELARPGDLVVVFPWYCGITYQRYTKSAVPFLTIPDFPEHRLHLHEQVWEKTRLGEAAIVPELERIERTLRAGGRVWVAGPLEAPSGPLEPLAPATSLTRVAPYLDRWELRLGELLKNHAREVWTVEVPEPAPVSVWERLPLLVAEGWK